MQLFLLTFSTICAILAISIAISCKIKLEAMEKSTHHVEYMPIDPNWASSDTAIKDANASFHREANTKDPDELDDDELNFSKII